MSETKFREDYTVKVQVETRAAQLSMVKKDDAVKRLACLHTRMFTGSICCNF